MKIFIGWDSRASIAYEIARDSIARRHPADGDKLDIMPLKLDILRRSGVLTRPVERRDDGTLWCPISQAPMATEFAISRFAVPLLTKGVAVFMDCDVLVLTDIAEIMKQFDPTFAVQVVKHIQPDVPEGTLKMDGQVQTNYFRKNWSSVVLWNCDHPSNDFLTLEMLNTAVGRDLHAFSWLKDDEIGELTPGWNWLVDVEPKPDELQIAHLTLGGPWFKDWIPGTGSMDSKWLSEADLYPPLPNWSKLVTK